MRLGHESNDEGESSFSILQHEGIRGGWYMAIDKIKELEAHLQQPRALALMVR